MKDLIFKFIVYSKQNMVLGPIYVWLKNFIKQNNAKFFIEIKTKLYQQPISKMQFNENQTTVQKIYDDDLACRLYKEIEFRNKLRGLHNEDSD